VREEQRKEREGEFGEIRTWNRLTAFFICIIPIMHFMMVVWEKDGKKKKRKRPQGLPP